MTRQAARQLTFLVVTSLVGLAACTPPAAPVEDAPSSVAAPGVPSARKVVVSLPTASPTDAPTTEPSDTAMPSPTVSPTALPSATATAAQPSGTVAPPADGLPASFELTGLTHVYQKWNNCGPSTVLMALSPFGIHLDQMDVQAQIKPDREDTNVTPEELAAFARGQGLRARVRVNGDRDIVRALLRAGVPVIAEQWIHVEGRGEMGHYRVAVGYDDPASEFVAQDSYYGPGRRFSYDDFDRMWRPFAGAYVAVYRPEQEAAVAAAIGADWSDEAMRARALADHEARAAAAPADPWAWFALGEVRSQAGQAAGAVEAFDRAIAIGLPFRAFWYQFGYYRALVATGAYDRALAHADATIDTMKGENLEESHYWRGVALRHVGRDEEARESFERALAFNPLFAPAQGALAGAPTP